MNTSEQINEIAAALAKAQAAMKPAVKDANNPAFKSKYADLTSVWEACRGPLSANGIAALQDVTMLDGKVAVTTRLVHSSGQWLEFGPLPVPSAKADAHGVGSATSYARRYALSAAVGIVADDDDGNGAVGHQAPVQAARPVPAGYQDWLDDMRAAADNGIDALQSAWKGSRSEYRAHITATDAGTWEGLKKKAARQAVTA